MCPAWWLLKKKKTMYHTGATDSRSVRTLMQFMMHPLTTAKAFEKAEPAFRDIQQYLLSLEAPKYPFAIDQPKVAKGEAVFSGQLREVPRHLWREMDLSQQGDSRSSEIGTDPKRHEGVGRGYGEAYAKSWFGQEKGEGIEDGKQIRVDNGYQAPPLDGIWATAPYFHNGSVPTLYHVLNSKSRPKLYTRSFKTDEADYDKEKVGWKITELTRTAFRETARRSSGARSTTRPSPAAATPATPSATT